MTHFLTRSGLGDDHTVTEFPIVYLLDFDIWPVPG
ncbi:hypothetical protein CEXT_736911, partial [Caerostris extrusa]